MCHRGRICVLSSLVPSQTSQRLLPVVGTSPPVAPTGAVMMEWQPVGCGEAGIVRRHPNFTVKAMPFEKGRYPWCRLHASWSTRCHLRHFCIPKTFLCQRDRLEFRPRGLLLWSVSSLQQNVLGHSASKLWRNPSFYRQSLPKPLSFFKDVFVCFQDQEDQASFKEQTDLYMQF